MYEFVQADMSHVEELGVKLRNSDVEEIAASSGRPPLVAMSQSFLKSPLCWTALRDGKPIAMFGAACQSVMSVHGSPWMLGSDDLDRAVLGIGRFSRYYVARMKQRFSILENFIDARQKRSIRWLKWCGFTVDKPAAIGLHGEPFHRFWIE
jgi:hypothetical protein